MSDDNIGGSELDLTHEDPTTRATVLFETMVVDVTAPNVLGGSRFKMVTRFLSGSPVQLALASVMIMGVACGIGAPWLIALIAGLCAPAVYYALGRLMPGPGAR